MYQVTISDVKLGQAFEAEAQAADKPLRPRTNIWGQGQGRYS